MPKKDRFKDDLKCPACSVLMFVRENRNFVKYPKRERRDKSKVRGRVQRVQLQGQVMGLYYDPNL